MLDILLEPCVRTGIYQWQSTPSQALNSTFRLKLYAVASCNNISVVKDVIVILVMMTSPFSAGQLIALSKSIVILILLLKFHRSDLIWLPYLWLLWRFTAATTHQKMWYINYSVSVITSSEYRSRFICLAFFI